MTPRFRVIISQWEAGALILSDLVRAIRTFSIGTTHVPVGTTVT